MTKTKELTREDLGIDLPEGREERSIEPPEIRVERQDGEDKVVGYAAVFDELSPPLWGFRERIEKGAFAKSIREADVRALWNHDRNLVLGRTKSRTLRLFEDDTGLGYEIDPPDTQWARDALVTIERGDVDQSSFGFEVIREEWTTNEDDENIRTLKEVKLFDVSPVTFPAYPQTSVQLRSLLGVDPYELSNALAMLESGALTPEHREMLQQFVTRVNDRLTAAPAEGGHPADEDEGTQGSDLRRLRLELAKRKN